MDNSHLLHLYSRAGFSITHDTFKALNKKSLKKNIEILFKESSKWTPLKVTDNNYLNSLKGFNTFTKEKKQKVLKENREKIKDLNVAWFNRILNPEEVLRERMTLFWANHFVCRGQNILHIEKYNNILRKNSLGNFSVLIKEVAHSASMLKYLNAKQNKKKSPNENFARELMELFTLGIGNYSEKDIKEAAKAFTGWSHKPNGEFILRENQHDNSIKTFFGESGNFNGDEIIDLILKQKQCAVFICTKVYKYFVNSNINKNHVDELAEVFYKNYNIEETMRYLLSSKWFYNEESIRTKIKSPIDLLTSINSLIQFKFSKSKQLLYVQKLLGQILLYPENVAGWKGGQDWIDTNTLMLRLKLPSIILSNSKISLEGIGEFEDTFEQYLKQKNKSYLKIETDWTIFNKNFKNATADQLEEFIYYKNEHKNIDSILSNIEFSSPKDYVIQLMSLPEFQLC